MKRAPGIGQGAFAKSPGSFKCAFVAARQADVSSARVESALAGIWPAKPSSYLNIESYYPKRFKDFGRRAAARQLDLIHILLENADEEDYALFGLQRLSWEEVVKTIKLHAPRIAVVEQIDPDVERAEWRFRTVKNIAEQAGLPFILSAHTPADDKSTAAYQQLYESVFRDEPIRKSIERCRWTDPDLAVTVHNFSESGILKVALGEQLARNDLLVRDYAAIRERADDVGVTIEATPPQEVRDLPSDPLVGLGKARTVNAEGQQAVTQSAVQIADAAGVDEQRFPVMWFYRIVNGGLPEGIHPNHTITAPTPSVDLEFQFWIDIVPSGIVTQVDVPAFTPPESTVYPISLTISLWSKDFRFKEWRRELTLDQRGPSAHARFPIEHIEGMAPFEAELFVFVQYRTTLVASFRVTADITDSVEVDSSPRQHLEHAYLASDWFCFEGSPSASRLTLFVTKTHNRLRMFALTSDSQPWPALGTTESELYAHNSKLYSELQSLASKAERLSAEGKTLNFPTEGRRLARRGHKLFTSIFNFGDQALAAFRERFFSPEADALLPEGSLLTIAISKDAEDLYVPWRLLYDRTPPSAYRDVPEIDGFWGARYNIVIQPSVTRRFGARVVHAPIRMGSVWLSHPETKKLEEFLQPYEQRGDIVRGPIRAENETLADIRGSAYDLIEFFCHGHSELPASMAAVSEQRMADYGREAANDPSKHALLMAIEDVDESLVEVDGGVATLSGLSQTLSVNLEGDPIILLSMCESAQVCSAGRGFVPLLLRRGARALIGTEGPTLWSLSREIDISLMKRLLKGATIGQAFFETSRELVQHNMLALIYTLYGDVNARLTNAD